tara:strand:- start:337 stop:1365 length:1029 start_codon:yes stop_codon:yes gene_type:complete
MQSPHLHVDDSILNYLRTASDPNALVLLPEMVPSPGEPEDKPEEEYAKRIYLAIKKLKAEYISMAKGDTIDQYLTNLTYRELVPFTDYLGYIQASNTNSNPEYKHSIALLSDLSNAPANLQTITKNVVDYSGDNGSMVKKLKLDNGVASSIPSIAELKEEISKIKDRIKDLQDGQATVIEEALADFDVTSGLANNTIDYILQVGDTLISIASRYGTTVTDILNQNEYPGAAIQSIDVLIPGESIVIPAPSNSTAYESLKKQKSELQKSIQREYTEVIAELEAELEEKKGHLDSLLSGQIPNANIANTSMKALYRPYDEHRRAHVLISFNELIYSTDKVKVTK